jgi:4-hydroxy-2-oxoheptanedioate aldolase
LSSHYAIEVVVEAGFDWLLDTEHSPNELDMVLTQHRRRRLSHIRRSRAVERHGYDQAVSDIRRTELAHSLRPERKKSARMLLHTRAIRSKDCAAWGNRHRAERFLAASKIMRRGHTRRTCVLVQVETQTAIDNIEKIAAVDGVDGCSLAQPDLHASPATR